MYEYETFISWISIITRKKAKLLMYLFLGYVTLIYFV
jgi:hypothetical protein